ncbi:hypothetical protein [Euzebya tangerina]|nr:hypothetical protein [Euzebya tangerina]
MGTIRVHRPVPPRAEVESGGELAERRDLPDDAVLTIIDNGKPRGRDLIERIADGLRRRLSIGQVEVHTKPSAGAPIDADVARMLAARSHLVISGLGD